MADKTPDRTFHDPDPSLDDPVEAAWFESLNALAFDVFEGAVNKAEARKFLNLSNVVAATEPTADAYEADLGGDLATGDVFEVDIPAANDTASPTFENTGGTPAGAQSIVDVDGNARIGMLEARPHKIQWDGTNFVLVDPQPLRPSTTGADPSLAFDTWRTPNADRPTLVIVTVRTATDGNTTGHITAKIDESGGTTADYTLNIGWANSNFAAATTVWGTNALFIPAGGSYRVVNEADPQGTNLFNTREFTL